MDGFYIDTFMQYISCICGYTLDTDLDTKVSIDNFVQNISTNGNHYRCAGDIFRNVYLFNL